jgi:hypothetical protein
LAPLALLILTVSGVSACAQELSMAKALQEQAQREPGNLGLQLDLAVALCSEGRVAQAQRLLLWLDAQPEIPFGIAEVISQLRSAGSCREDRPRWRPVGFAALGIGHSTNLNLGPASERIFISGLGQDLTLAETSRPLAASTRQAEAGVSVRLNSLHPAARAFTASAYGQVLDYADQPQYRLQAAHLLLSWKPESTSGILTEAQAAVATLRLGDGTGLLAHTLNASRMWPIGEAGWWGVAGTKTWLQFAQRPQLDARQLDLRMKWRHEDTRWRLGIDAGFTADMQAHLRPGGNRVGGQAQVQGAWVLRPSTALEASWRRSRLVDGAPYSPLLFGSTERDSRVTAVSVGLRQRMSSQWGLRLEARHVQARDTVPLFTYQTKALTLVAEYAFGAEH